MIKTKIKGSRRVLKICKVCGRKFSVKLSESKKGVGKYCSKICYSQKGKQNPHWKGGISQQKKICLTCKKEFIGSWRNKYCSVQCVPRIDLKQKGYRAEREALKILTKEGFKVGRSPGSIGIWDIIAIDSKQLRLIQVKSLKTDFKINPFSLYKKDIKRMEGVKNKIPPLPMVRQELWIKIFRRGWEKYFYNNLNWNKINE